MAATGAGPVHDLSNFTEIFLGVFRRDILSLFPGCRLELDLAPILNLAGKPAEPPRVSPTFALDFQIDEDEGASPESVRISIFGVWHRLTVSRPLGLGPRDRELIRAVGRVMELHHQVLFRSSRMTLLQLRRGMPEDHYIAASVEPSAYSPAASSPSRTAEAILTLRTMALSTYENRRVTTGALILSQGLDQVHFRRRASQEALDFAVELTGLKSLHRLCDGRRTLLLVDRHGKLADLVDIRQWAIAHAWGDFELPDRTGNEVDASHRCDDDPSPVLPVPCPRVYTFHALATRKGGHVCLVLSPNQEIKVFAEGVQAFVFAHGRWRVLDPEAKFAMWAQAVADQRLARVLFQTALDLAEERQGGLLVVVSEPAQAIGRLIAPHDVLEAERALADQDEPIDQESPARPFTLFGLTSPPDQADGDLSSSGRGVAMSSIAEPQTKRSIHYLARGASVTELDAAVLEALAGLDGALVTDAGGRLIAFGAILRHQTHSFRGPDPDALPAIAEGARTTAALAASNFGPVLKVSEDGIVSCFFDGARVWDL
jgi:hypothetical protein